jgi:uncharacterized protein
MEIKVHQITSDGVSLHEQVPARNLHIDAEGISFPSPFIIDAYVYRFTNTVTADITVKGELGLQCSRCLGEFSVALEKRIKCSYPVERPDETIDFNPQIREEIILDYPMKPLCSDSCKGLCVHCGKNLNEGGCSCGSTKKKAF